MQIGLSYDLKEDLPPEQDSPDDALEKLEAGASLVQVYTGFIYNGPALVKEIKKALLRSDQ